MDIDITLPQRAYAIFESLNYDHWNAIGEFIDNSIQSYLNSKVEIKKSEKKYKLKIEINLTQNTLEIIDNSSGIDEDRLKKGLKPATKPEISSGLSEFGMGLKTAAFWICKKWSIITKHFDSEKEFTVMFDNEEIYSNEIKKIPAFPRDVKDKTHYTKLILENINFDGTDVRIINELKENLSSMYRYYLRDKEIEIFFNKEKLSFEKFEVLKGCKVYGDNKEINWEKDIEFTLSNGKTITGYAGLLANGKPLKAGFTYLRRNRVIEGLVEGVKDEKILGSANKEAAQRVFAELNMDSFRVSHTKDKILFQGSEVYEFKEKLKEILEDGTIKLLTQARQFSYKDKTNEPKNSSKKTVVSKTSKKGVGSSKSNILDVNISDFDDQEVSIRGNINVFAEQMKKSYEEMYKIENVMRLLIKNVELKEKVSFLHEDHYSEVDDKIIIRRINGKIDYLKGEEEKEGTISVRGKHDIYYANFSVIKTILELNYDKYFSGYFVRKQEIISMLERLYAYRNNIAHNSYLKKSERDYITSSLPLLVGQLNGKIKLD